MRPNQRMVNRLHRPTPIISKRPLDSSSKSEDEDESLGKGKRNFVRCKGPVRFLEDSEDDNPNGTAERYTPVVTLDSS